MTETLEPTQSADSVCPHCGKPSSLCICEGIVPIDTRIEVLILQHPQEQDKELGTARLTAFHCKKATFKVGLSWPSLAKALGREADPKRWAILYLGSTRPESFAAGQDVAVLDKGGNPLPDQAAALAGIQGIIVLDGTWSQAKTLWWRNAWMLKGKRIALRPRQPSLYGKLRREPRREALSTLESTAFLLSRLERKPEIEATLLASFAKMLAKYRAARGSAEAVSKHRRSAGRR